MILMLADLLIYKQCLSTEQVRDPTPGHTRYSPLHTFAGFLFCFFFWLRAVATRCFHGAPAREALLLWEGKSWNSRFQLNWSWLRLAFLRRPPRSQLWWVLCDRLTPPPNCYTTHTSELQPLLAAYVCAARVGACTRQTPKVFFFFTFLFFFECQRSAERPEELLVEN